MKQRVPLLCICALSTFLFACATNPVTGQREFSLMSEGQEIAIGQQADVEVRREMGIYEDKQLQEYVSTIGLRLAQSSERPKLPWHFAVVDEPAINAFALPGGYIYLTRGILPFLDDESQLAGVLGHEIGHVTARHAAQQYSRATGAQLGLILGSIFVPAARPFGQLAESALGLLFLKHGRDDELQADSLGVRYAASAGWNPAGVAGMLTTLDRVEEETTDRGIPNWLATHPAPEDRVQKVQAAIQAASTGTGTRGVVDRDDYLRRIDGIVYGDNPEEGVVRGSEFLHAGLRFALNFPSGWEVNNSASQVVAKQPGANVFVVLQLVEQPVGRNIEQVAVNSMQKAGFRALEGSRSTINGLDAFVGTYEGTLQDLGRVGVRAAHIAHERNIFMVAGLAPTQLFERAERELTTTIRSFRPLTAAQAEAIRPNRVDLYTAREGDTWQSIAERQGKGLIKPTTLAIMNGHAVNDQPRPGERLKIVVAG
jgi:predicted Zn-dependent protease